MSTLNTLTSLSRVRSWAGVVTTNDDATLTALISEVSRFILNYLGRPSLFDKSHVETLDGAGQSSIMLRYWPVTMISSLMIGSSGISAALDGSGNGFVLDAWDGMSGGTPQRLALRGYRFSRGVSNVKVSYNAGYKIANELQTIPAGGNYSITVNAPHGNWGADIGITYSNGTTLQLVANSPAQGQYMVNAGLYSFSVADAGQNVLLSYSYIPADIEHACVALVAERYRYRSRIGETSKSLGGQETVSFTQKDMPEFVRTLLQPYRRVFAFN